MIRFIAIFSLLLSFSISAHSAEFQIREVSKSRKRILIKKSSRDNIKRGSKFIIEFETGGQCTLKALKVKKKTAILSASRCKKRRKIKKGQLVTLMDGSMEVDSISDSSSSRRRNHSGFSKSVGVGLHYNMANSIGISGTDTTGTSDYDAVSSGAIGLQIEYLKLNPGSIGFSGGFGYELSRDIEGAVGLLNGVTQNGAWPSPIPTFGAMYLYGNGNYTINSNFYLSGGINYSLLSYEYSLDPNKEASGGLGFQVGAGYFFNNSMGVEFLYKIIKGSLSNSSNKNVDLSLSMSGIHIGFKYLFF